MSTTSSKSAAKVKTPSHKSRKSGKRDKVKHSGKHSGKAIRRKKIGGGSKGSWKDVPDFDELTQLDTHTKTEEESPSHASLKLDIISKPTLAVNTNIHEMEEQTSPSERNDQVSGVNNQFLSVERMHMEPQLVQVMPLLQSPEQISIKPQKVGERGPELIAVACSNLTNQIWDGQVTLLEANSDMSDISFRRNIATYGGNTSVGWIGELLLCGGDDGAVYAWQLEEINEPQTQSYDPASPTFSLDSDSKDKKKLPDLETKSSSDSEQKKDDQLPAIEGDGMEIQDDDVSIKNLIAPYPKMVLSFYDHSDCVSAIATASTFPGKFVTSSWDCTMKLWDIEHSATPAATCQHNTRVFDMKWNPHESHCHTVLTGAQDGIFMWDIRSNSNYVGSIQSDDAIYALAWDAHNPHFFATGSETGCVNVIDLRMLTTHDSSTSTSVLASYNEGKGIINDIQYSPFSPGLIATTCNDTVVRILHLDNEELATVWTCPGKDYARGLHWSSTDPNRLMVTSWDPHCAIAVYDTMLFNHRSH